MKVYIGLLIPYGDLKYDCNVDILGVFPTRKEAIDYIYKGTVEPDIIFNDYLANLKELTEFIEGSSNNLDVYFRVYENYDCYYSVQVIEKEVIG